MHPINELKRLAIEAKEISDVFNYFFDLMDNNVIFNLNGHRAVQHIETRNELAALLAAVQYSASQRIGKPIQIITPMLYEVPEQQFVHGSCLALNAPSPLPLLYFSNLQTGLFAMHANGNTDFFRFSLARQADMEKKH